MTTPVHLPSLHRGAVRARSRMARAIARRHGRPVARAVARAAQAYRRAYENQDYDLVTNGEAALLDALGPNRVAVALDVGAFRGEWAQAVLDRHPRAVVHCFEPVPGHLAVLRSAHGADPRIRIHGYGLGDTAEEVTIRRDPAAPSTASRYGRAEHDACEAHRVELRTGDEVVRRHGIDHVDLLKVDTEGGELAVLLGFDHGYLADRVDVVQFEHNLWSAVAGASLRRFHDLLGTAGFRVGRLHPRGVDFSPYRIDDEDHPGGNYVAVAERTELTGRLARFG